MNLYMISTHHFHGIQRCVRTALMILLASAPATGRGQDAPAAPALPAAAVPANVSAPLPPAAQEAFDKGVIAAKEQEWMIAIKSFDNARKLAPASPIILFNLGLAESKIPGRELRAIGWMRAYLALAPEAANGVAVREQLIRLDVRAESRANEIITLLKQLATQLPAESGQARAANASLEALTTALAAPVTPPAASSDPAPLSPAECAEAWAAFVQDSLSTPLFTDFRTTLVAAGVAPASSDNKAWKVYAAAHALAGSWLDRLTALHQLGTKQQPTKSDFARASVQGNSLTLAPLKNPPTERPTTSRPVITDADRNQSGTDKPSRTKQKATPAAPAEDLDAKFRKAAERFEK